MKAALPLTVLVILSTLVGCQSNYCNPIVGDSMSLWSKFCSGDSRGCSDYGCVDCLSNDCDFGPNTGCRGCGGGCGGNCDQAPPADQSDTNSAVAGWAKDVPIQAAAHRSPADSQARPAARVVFVTGVAEAVASWPSSGPR